MKTLSLLKEDHFWSKVRQKDFQLEWDNLYVKCPWASAFQSRAFVYNWYFYNQNEFQPILVTYHENNKLLGLLALAIPHGAKKNSGVRNNRPRIVGAGEYEAEYQTWLAVPSESDNFIKLALDKVFTYFPSHDIMFRYLTSSTPISWTQEAYWDKKCVAQPYKRPFMEMADAEFLKIFKKRGFKLKLNRLKRLGKLEFIKVTELNQFEPLLEELTVQFDFRQGAMFNKVSYKGRPSKLEFLRELFKENLLHVTILKIDDEIVSSIVAVKDEESANLGGINTHSPFFAQHSPGFVHFILLGDQLVKDKVKVFDLTPGGDAYKERLATSSDIVFDLLITNSKSYFLKRKLRRRLHDRLIKSGIRPMSMELAIKKNMVIFKRKLAKINPKLFLQFLINGWKNGSVSKLQLNINDFYTPISPLEIKENCLENLLCYEYEKANRSRWEFLEEAMKKFESGERCYTWVENNKLLACVWFQISQDQNGQDSSKENRLLLNSLYIHSMAGPSVQSFFYKVLLKLDIVYDNSLIYYQGYINELKNLTSSNYINIMKRLDN